MSRSRPGGTCNLWTSGMAWGTFVHGNGRSPRTSVHWLRLALVQCVCVCVFIGGGSDITQQGHGYRRSEEWGPTAHSPIPSYPPSVQIRCQLRHPEHLDDPGCPQPGPVRKCLPIVLSPSWTHRRRSDLPWRSPGFSCMFFFFSWMRQILSIWCRLLPSLSARGHRQPLTTWASSAAAGHIRASRA